MGAQESIMLIPMKDPIQSPLFSNPLQLQKRTASNCEGLSKNYRRK